MSTRLLAVVMLCLFVGVPGSVSAGDPPAGVPEAVRTDADALLGHFEALAGLLESHADGTCAELATALEGFAAEHGAAMRETGARLEAIDAGAERALQQAYGSRLAELQARMLPALTACVGDEAVVAAMESLSSGKPEKPKP